MKISLAIKAFVILYLTFIVNIFSQHRGLVPFAIGTCAIISYFTDTLSEYSVLLVGWLLLIFASTVVFYTWMMISQNGRDQLEKVTKQFLTGFHRKTI